MQYGIATSIFSHADLETSLRGIAAAGFNQVEINAELPHFFPGRYEPCMVRRWLDELGLRAPVGHGLYAYQAPNAAALDEAERRCSVELIQSCFAPLAAVGVEYIVLHPTGYSKEYAKQNREAHMEQARKSIRELAKSGGELGLHMAWENLPHHGVARPLHDMRELRQLVDDMPANVGLCLDTTHATISGHEPVEQAKVAADRLFCLHLHDTDGHRDCHWVPGKGVIDWEGFLDQIDDMAFGGTRTLEVASTPEMVKQVLADTVAVARRWSNR